MEAFSAKMTKQALLILAIVIAFGIFIPWIKGLDFLDPVMILAYSCLALLFVAPAAAEAFAGRQFASRAAALARMGAVLAYGWGIAALILAAGIATVNAMNWHGRLIAPSPKLLAAALLLSLAASAAVIALTGLLTRRLTARGVKSVLRLGFLALLLALAFGNRALPEEWRMRISSGMTTRGITNFAFTAAALLALTCAALTAAWFSGVDTRSAALNQGDGEGHGFDTR
jgi:hypothetical protein